ncbi:hypothetical protein [Sandaracinus amylolyticus]|uniref:hypothetical protein n=1 Tax=Sandaracinus amylolyticus TaxID=927083 RepID=UPI0012ED905B|nr:hypothetical protein [Sandaracinus amylolyticus]
MISPTPRAPLDSWPVQAFDARFGLGWWTDPAVLVFQATVEQATAENAELVQSWIDLALRHRKEEIAEAGGLFIFHDWRSVRAYDTEARKAYLARMRARPRDYLRHSVTVISAASPLLRMAVETGNLVASMVAGRKVEIAHDPVAVMREHEIRPPAIGTRFPGTGRPSSRPPVAR